MYIYIYKSTFFKAQENFEFTLIRGLSLPSPVAEEHTLTREPSPGGKTPPWRLSFLKNTLLLPRPKSWLLTTTQKKEFSVVAFETQKIDHRTETLTAGPGISSSGPHTTKVSFQPNCSLCGMINRVCFFINCWEATKFKQSQDSSQE